MRMIALCHDKLEATLTSPRPEKGKHRPDCVLASLPAWTSERKWEAGLDATIIRRRIETLKAEMDAGRRRLAELEAEANSVRETLLRLSGAIQVLEEVAAEASPES